MAENSLSDSCVAAGPGHLRRQADQAVRDLRPLFDLGFSVAECVSASGRIGQIEQLLTSRSNEGAARALLNMSCATRALTVARQNGYQTVTIGIGGSAQFGFGVNSEIGIAFDTSDRYQPVGYSTLGYTTGWGAALSNEVIVSFYKDDLRGLASDAQGFSYSGAAVAGGGATVWYDYDGRQSGASAAAGIGAGGEIGVYNRVTTQLLGAVRPQTRNSGPDRLAPAKGAVISGDYRLTDRDATKRFEMLGDNALRVTRLQNGRPTEWHVYNRVNAHTFRADTSRATYSVLRDGTLRWQSNSDRNLVIDLVEDTFSETGIVWQ